MATQEFEMRAGSDIAACPRCQNMKRFTAKSEQVAEDCCEVWVECTCGFDPTSAAHGERLEDVMGHLDAETIGCAVSIWNDLIRTAAYIKSQAGPA